MQFNSVFSQKVIIFFFTFTPLTTKGMYNYKQFKNYKRHLKDRYVQLLELSNDYRFEDEAMSDMAAYKAMKLLEKLNQVQYLDREVAY